ncbi:hypothetical protein M9Y10_025280 [Tritrichomonas musculus]|uniref:Uncharacterized protein n=1 Tax=Tritrichomonas musculus TaxID=1915356 RepID=A0ABR2GLS6_9EUKA
MDLPEKLLSSKDPSKILLEQGGSFYNLIEKLHQFTSLPDELMTPIIEVGHICEFNFYRITQPLLKSLVQKLEECIDDYPDMIPEILESLHPYLNCSNFYSLFEKIVVKMPSLPDYFLLSLVELPSDQLLEIFPSHQSRAVIFLKCRPIFHRLVFTIINEFVDDPINLDRLLNSIKLIIPKKPAIDDFSHEFDFHINIHGMKGRSNTLRNLHNELCENAKDQLLDLCCEKADLYQEICCILRDLWEKTGNPLYAALRVEIGSQNLTWRQDPILSLSKWIFAFLSSHSLSNSDFPPSIDSKDASFVTNDPLFQYLIYCLFLRLLVIRVSKNTYIQFNKREESGIILPILYPHLSPVQIEDFANYIEAYYVASDLFEDPSCEESNSLRSLLAEMVEKDNCFSNLLLFCGQQLIQRRQDQTIIDMIANIPNIDTLKPDIIIAHVMIMHLTDAGIAEVTSSDIPSDINICVDKRLKIIFNWSKFNHSIRLYFIALLEKRSRELLKIVISSKNESSGGQKDEKEPFYMNEFNAIEKWINLIYEQFDDLDEIENSILDEAKSIFKKINDVIYT